MSLKTKIVFSVILVALGAACRLLPHFWNFAPITAMALFSGAYLGRRWGIVVPLLAMFAGDLFIGFYEWPLMIIVYACFALFGLAGSLLSGRIGLKNVAIASLGASLGFFIATNWAVWQFSPWYAKTVSGLLECYLAALPFYRNTLLGDVFYTAVFFGAMESLKVFNAQRRFKLAYRSND